MGEAAYKPHLMVEEAPYNRCFQTDWGVRKGTHVPAGARGGHVWAKTKSMGGQGEERSSQARRRHSVFWEPPPNQGRGKTSSRWDWKRRQRPSCGGLCGPGRGVQQEVGSDEAGHPKMCRAQDKSPNGGPQIEIANC